MQPTGSAKRLSLIGRILALALPALFLFGVIAFLAGLSVGRLLGTPLFSPGNIYLGVVCALIISLFIAAFCIRKERLVLPFGDRALFLEELGAEMQALGYELRARTEGFLTFKPSFHALVLGGAIHVQLDSSSAQIVGPRVYLERLRYRLRVHSHLDNVQRTLKDPRRPTERRLKQIEIGMCISAKQWQGIYKEVVALLARQHAAVVCAVNLTADCEAGIPDQVAVQICQALRQQGIQATIQTKPAEESTPGESKREVG